MILVFSEADANLRILTLATTLSWSSAAVSE